MKSSGLEALQARQFLERRTVLGPQTPNRERALDDFVLKHQNYRSSVRLESCKALVPDLIAVFQYTPPGLGPDDAARNAMQLLRTNEKVVILYNGAEVLAKKGDTLVALVSAIKSANEAANQKARPRLETKRPASAGQSKIHSGIPMPGENNLDTAFPWSQFTASLAPPDTTELKGGTIILDLDQVGQFVGKDVAFTLEDDINNGRLLFGRVSRNNSGSYDITLLLAPGGGDGRVGFSDVKEQRLVLREATAEEISGLRLSYS